MNPRERILSAINHEPPDRTPTAAWFHREVEKRLLDHYHTDVFEDVLRELGIEGWTNLSASIAFPEYETRASDRPGGRPGRRAIWLDDRTYEDGWGVVYRLGEGDWYEERVKGPLEHAAGADEVDAYGFPGSDRIIEPTDYAAQVAELKRPSKFVTGGIPNPYKIAWQLRGMDNILSDYLINPDIISLIYDRLYALYTDMAVRMVIAGVDMISVTGDVAMQDRIIMGPEAWRRFDKPRLAALIDACRRANPDVFMFIHSDGDVSDIMDDLVEIGFNVINPIQPECMNPFEVKRRWGDRITLHGGVSIQKTLPFGTPAAVQSEIETLIRGCGYDGGLVVFPSNVIQPDTPIENIIACFHAARDLPVGSLGGMSG